MNIQVDPTSSNLASAMLNSKIRPRTVVGYGVKIFHLSPPNYVTKSPGCDWAQKYFLCPIRVQLFLCYFRDFLFEHVHRQTFCSPDRHFNIYLLVQESFPRELDTRQSEILTVLLQKSFSASADGCLYFQPKAVFEIASVF